MSPCASATARHTDRREPSQGFLAGPPQALEAFAALEREHGFRPVISYAPSTYTAYADFVTFENEALSELMPWFSRMQRAYLRQKAEDLGLAFVDLTPALQTATRRHRDQDLLYYPANVHSPSGHRVVSDAPAAAITQFQSQPPSIRGKAD